MIAKDLDPFSGSDKFAVAGRRAEEQMAYYLRRFFGASEEVQVLNHLRIVLGEEVAQMDHLVVHPFGLTIVESKSVAGSVQIKDDGQWIRWFEKRPQGMRSPVIQARMQAMLLRDLLNRAVKPAGFFDKVDLDILVAISDTGTIQWPSSGPIPEVCKADQAAEKIGEKLVSARKAARPDVLPASHRAAITEFLAKIHQPLAASGSAPTRSVEPKPLTPTAAPPKPSSPPAPDKHFGRGAPLPAKVCKHCGGNRLEARYGKFGYYFVCIACEQNTAIRFNCPKCGGEGRLRKQGKEFFAECKSCAASELYHTNS